MMQTYFWRVIVQSLKTETRRVNSQSWVDSHVTACVNSNLIRVWCGKRGLVTGHILYNFVYTQQLCDMTVGDLEQEGFGEGGVTIEENAALLDCVKPFDVTDFCEIILGGIASQRRVTVFNFTFFPYT